MDRPVPERPAQEPDIDRIDLIAGAVVGIFRSLPEGRFLWVNRALAAMCGYESPEQMMREVRDIGTQLYVDPELRRDVMARLRETDRLVQVEIDARRRDGSVVPIRISYRAIRDPEGRIVRLEGFVEDISESRAARLALEEKSRDMEALLDALPDALLIYDEEGRFLSARPGSEVELMSRPDSLIGLRFSDVLPRPLAEITARCLEGLRSDGRTRRTEYSLLLGGRMRWFEALFTPLPRGRTLCMIRDLTHIREIEGKFDLARTIIDNVREGVVVTDSSGTIEQVNGAFTEITGYAPEEVLGGTPRVLKSDHHSPEFYESLWESLLERGEWRGEIWNRRKTGEIYPEWMTIHAVRSSSGEVLHYIAIFSDLTEIKEKDAQLLHQTYHDRLTGLPNRTLLYDRLRVELRASAREGNRVALLLLDLDRFKMLNNTLGYPAGDQVLIEAGRRLRETCGEFATVSHTGADGFAVLLSGLDSPALAGAQARRILDVLRSPLRLGEHSVYLSASLGIAVHPEDGRTAEELMRKAENALYRAKSRGGGAYAFASEDLDAEFSRKLRLESGLRRALEEREFLLHYQPIVELRSGRILGLEALLRWPVPDGFVPPAEFIPLAEETGLILPLGEEVFRMACRAIRDWRDAGIPLLPVSVNVSAVQVADPIFYETVRGVLNEYAVSPSSLTLEITEQSLMHDRDRVKALFRRFKALGLSVYIDDFGTGYSSLSYLKDFAFDGIKIDRSFVVGLGRNPRDVSLVEVILNLARALGLHVVVEGVEEEPQLRILYDLGAPSIQGYCFARPMPGALRGPLSLRIDRPEA